MIRHPDNKCGANELIMVVIPPTMAEPIPKPIKPRHAHTSNFDIDIVVVVVVVVDDDC